MQTCKRAGQERLTDDKTNPAKRLKRKDPGNLYHKKCKKKTRRNYGGDLSVPGCIVLVRGKTMANYRVRNLEAKDMIYKKKYIYI